MHSPLEKIRIVLVNTSHPGNIGAAARAMKTMGLSQLFLVNPKNFPNEQATALAAGAEDLLEKCHVKSSLLEALSGCHFVIATSARERRLPWPAWNPRAASQLAVNATLTKEVAIVFGSERTGLLNEELQMSHGHLIIPANPDYTSLNLAAAVQVVCYELRMAFLSSPLSSAEIHGMEEDESPATVEEIECFYQHLEKVLMEIQFLHKAHPVKLMSRLRRLFQRAQMSQVELNVLHGILTAVEKL
jgi:tRNA (cytidine32/uridine32-2'-O)-methyltransferase